MLMAETISFTIPEPQLEDGRFTNDLPVILESGKPQLAYIPVKILLPMGHKLQEVEIIASKQTQTITEYVKPAPQMQPISKPGISKTSATNVYELDQVFPENDFEIKNTQRYRGYDFAIINIFPYRYNPVKQEITYSRNLQLHWNSSFNQKLATEQAKKVDENREVLDNFDFYNTAAIYSYENEAIRSKNLPTLDDPYSMIVITDSQREAYFTDFINWKEDQGVHTGLFLVEDIYSNYSGIDPQTQIRNFIIDAYETYSSTSYPLEYVFLGGDDEIVPIRGCYGQVGGTVDYSIPTDMYYGCLDGDWDADGDGIYGEPNDNVDFFSEVAVGRIPAETEEEFTNFFNKNYNYVDTPMVSNDIAYMFGENLDDYPTWGGDYKDQVLADCSIDEDGYLIGKLYERDGTYSAAAIKDLINSGVGIINHMGHSNETVVFGQSPGNAQQYYNTEYGFVYSQGCYPAAFDTATSGSGESVAENMVIASGGFYAFVGNTRYGWYSPGNVWGASEYFDIEFFQAVFDYDIRQLGKANDYSKMELINQIQSSSVMRWVAYELVLFGDPSIEVKEYNGTFPFLQPAAISYNDINGDGDGTVNPGETIEMEISIENLPNWAEAENVYAKISFEDDAVNVVEDSVFYGNISSGQLSESEPFMVQVPQDCNYDAYSYDIRIIAPVGDGFFDRTYTQSFQVSLYQENWPAYLNTTINSNPIITDYNGDNELDILAVDNLGGVSLFDNQAQMQSGFPWDFNYNIWKSPAYADLDNDGNSELVYASRNSEIVAIQPDGEFKFEYVAESGQLFTPVLADVNGNGNLEVISFGMDRKLIVLNSAGEMLPGFPVQFPAMIGTELAAADLNSDGSYEIILASLDGNLNVLNSSGESMAGFPVSLGAAVVTSPIILQNNTIVVSTLDKKIKLISNTGEIITELETPAKILESPIAADFDNDEQQEIAFSMQNREIAIIEQDGSYLEGWPVSIAGLPFNPALAADIDNDNIVELLQFTSLNNLYIFKPDGQIIDFSPVEIDLSGNLPASIADIDQDGDAEVVSGIANGVYAIDIKTEFGSKHPWKTYRGNYRRTGYSVDNLTVSNYPQDLPQSSQKLFAAYPNPFNPTTNIAFNISQPAQVEIDIYNVKGQKIKTLTRQQYEKGKHILIWNGKDEQTRSVASGVYFYKMQVDGNTIDVRKCMLIK